MKKIIFILFIFPCFLFGQNIDSLKLALKNAKHDTTRCNILSILTETASDEEWPVFNEQLKILAEKNLANNNSPKNFYLKHLATAFNNIGYLAKFKGDIIKSLNYLHKGLKIQEEINDKKGKADSYYNIGLMYRDQGDHLKALEYNYKSFRIQEELGDTIRMAYSLNNIGTIYDNQGEADKALKYYLMSLKMMEQIGDKQGIATGINNIGFTYDKKGNIEKALEYYFKALKIREENNDKLGIAISLNNIARLKFKKGQIAEAILFADKGMKMSMELGYPENIKNSANTLKTIFQKQNKYKEAFEMYELEVKMRDSINNEETQKAAVKKQMQYQYESQARELKNEQDKKDIIAKAELQQREKERNYFIVGFALVIVLAGFIFRSYRQKQKANILIAQQKHEVEESRKEILDSIHYAKRIQKAHLPTLNYIEKNLNRLQNRG
ncbi:MAG: tetratricopeptide repeat protein [Sphingobacteriaceae bacterium]|nr:tetratricopeptide repeat protein [Sphingobacteriaceae bacterium]